MPPVTSAAVELLTVGPSGLLGFLADCQVTVGLVGRRGRRGRPPKLTVTTEQQAQRRRDRLQEV